MRRFGYPVVFDATYSVQLPGGAAPNPAVSAEFVRTRPAAAGAGCDRVFMEVHPDPIPPSSDGRNMVPLHALHSLLERGYYVPLATQPPHNRSGNAQDQDIRRAFCQRRCESVREGSRARHRSARCSISKPVWMSDSPSRDAVVRCQGKVVISGMGKIRAHIGQKMRYVGWVPGHRPFFCTRPKESTATWACSRGVDVLIAISTSGETQEVLRNCCPVRQTNECARRRHDGKDEFDVIEKQRCGGWMCPLMRKPAPWASRRPPARPPRSRW